MPWLEETLGPSKVIFVLDDHSIYGGLGDSLLNACMASDILRNKRVIKFAIADDPACGTPPEVLRYHKVDGESLAKRIMTAIYP